MDITMIGLQNAGKTSLLRVLAVSSIPNVVLIVEDVKTNSWGLIGRRVHY
jgi:GTPase SAR1 family protein